MPRTAVLQQLEANKLSNTFVPVIDIRSSCHKKLCGLRQVTLLSAQMNSNSIKLKSELIHCVGDSCNSVRLKISSSDRAIWILR